MMKRMRYVILGAIPGAINIRLGPTLPAFVSPGVLEILAKTYGLKPTTTAEADLKAILG